MRRKSIEANLIRNCFSLLAFTLNLLFSHNFWSYRSIYTESCLFIHHRSFLLRFFSLSMFFQPLPSTMLRYFLDRSVRMTVSVVLSWNELPFSSFPSLFKILVTHRPTYTPSRNFSLVLLQFCSSVPAIFPRSKASFSKGLKNSTISESNISIMRSNARYVHSVGTKTISSIVDNYASRGFLRLRHSILFPSRSSNNCIWRHVVWNYCIAWIKLAKWSKTWQW